MISLLLNFPYTVLGLLLGLISFPQGAYLHSRPYAIILSVKSFWWGVGYIKNSRAMAIGNVILISQRVEKGDLKHELIHVKQHDRAPLIYPILYYFELWRHGYRKNKYEEEAYQKAGNVYKS